jgi:hydrogenase 3 maturation protease
MGNRLKGDDGVGSYICDLIQDRVRVPVLDVGTALENYLGPISQLQPEAILVLDAAELGLDPGGVTILERDALACTSTSTHTVSVDFMLRSLDRDSQILLRFLGIQPKYVRLGESLSAPVRARAHQMGAMLRELWEK